MTTPQNTEEPATPPPGAATPESGNTGTATATRPKPNPPRVDSLPPYRVLLHNDDVNDHMHVLQTLMELTPLDKERSVLVMLEAEKTGVALVLMTHKERAELYADQFKSKSLTVTIEPAEK